MRKIAAVTMIFVFMTVTVFAEGSQIALNNWLENFGPAPVYTDLDDVRWAEDAIYHLSQYGVIHDDNGAVYPKRFVSRNEFTELIIGSFGMYDSEAECSFTDVKKDSFYYPYIASAYELGIIKGVSETQFGGELYLYRQDMAVIIYRLAEICGIDLSQKAELTFVDSGSIDDYAKDAVAALVSAGAVSGDENNCFLPYKYSTFAEACKIVYYLLLKNT